MTVTIDVGTSAVKVLQFNDGHHVIQEHAHTYPTLYTDDGEAEQDPDKVVAAVLHCLEKLQLTHSETIILSGAMHSLMAVDQNFKPQTQLMIWADQRASDVIKAFKLTPVASRFFSKTKTPLHPMSPFAKFLWMKETEAGQLLKKTLPNVFWIDMKTYLWYHLTGYCELDFSLASATGLFNSDTLSYDDEILAYVDLKVNQLPQLVPVKHTRPVTEKVAAQLGSHHQIMIGASDGVLANISEGLDKQDVHVTIGTSGAIRMTVPEPYVDEKGRLFCYYLDDAHWVIGGAVNNGGNVLKWLDELLFDGTEAIYDYIDTLDFQTFDSTLVFVPHLNGERAPFWDTGRTGHLDGVKISHTKADIVKAVVYGLLFNLRHVFDMLNKVTGDIEAVYISGGFFKVAQFKALISQVLHVSVKESTTLEQTSKGALRLFVDIEHRKDYNVVTEQPSKQQEAYYERYLQAVLKQDK
ncbi:MAG: gluconokinase [Bacillota bacterium]